MRRGKRRRRARCSKARAPRTRASACLPTTCSLGSSMRRAFAGPAAKVLEESGGLEVPSSNLGARSKEPAAYGGFFSCSSLRVAKLRGCKSATNQRRPRRIQAGPFSHCRFRPGGRCPARPFPPLTERTPRSCEGCLRRRESPEAGRQVRRDRELRSGYFKFKHAEPQVTTLRKVTSLEIVDSCGS
jgi:hypothetical protein